MPGGAEVPEDPAGGGAGAGPSFQTLPAQHHLSVHGAGLPRGGRGQSLAGTPRRSFFQARVSLLIPVSLARRQRSSPDVKAEMFELLYQILHQNWRYFFKTSVLTSVQRGLPEDNMENEAQFTAAMQVRTRRAVADLLFLTARPLTSLLLLLLRLLPGVRPVFPAARHPHLQAEPLLLGVAEQQTQVVSQSE